MLDRISKRHIIFLSLLSMLAVASIFYFKSDQYQDTATIRSYEHEKDFIPLVQLINENKFWISERRDFSAEKMLLHRIPTNDQGFKGQATVDVIQTNSTTAGFIAYYKKSAKQGFIWLLAVDKAFRGRGFGEKLMLHAIDNLKQQKVNYITIATRLINKPALSLYRKLGFKEKYRDEKRGIITLIKKDLP
jgi:ribosomal protein S18 acetylase RimI-like enzyme